MNVATRANQLFFNSRVQPNWWSQWWGELKFTFRPLTRLWMWISTYSGTIVPSLLRHCNNCINCVTDKRHQTSDSCWLGVELVRAAHSYILINLFNVRQKDEDFCGAAAGEKTLRQDRELLSCRRKNVSGRTKRFMFVFRRSSNIKQWHKCMRRCAQSWIRSPFEQ